MTTNTATSTPSVTERIGQICRALDGKRAVNALRLARGYRDGSPEMENALAVCLMRTGESPEARRILQGLLFPDGITVMDATAPAKYKVNYVYVLLKLGRTKQALSMMTWLANEKDPAVIRLREAIKRWRRSLPWTARILLALRLAFPKKVKLDVPAGEA